MSRSLSSTPSRPSRPSSSRPEDWWRFLCWVDDLGLGLCGDLPGRPAPKRAQLDDWVAAGVTHIVDVRGEASDEGFVAEWAPGIHYTWLGTHDHGGAQDPEWFTAGVTAIRRALSQPHAKVVVHCHMGVNRAPSMAFAALLDHGYDPVRALDAIRSARPIAAVLYAEDAVRWWAGVTGTDAAPVRRRVRQWHADHPCDTGWIISRIRRAEWDDWGD